MRSAIFLGICSFVLALVSASAGQSTAESPDSYRVLHTDSLCGIRCIYVALRILDREVNFSALVADYPEAVKSGVSFRDLSQIAERSNLNTSLGFFSASELMLSRGVAIVYLDRSTDSRGTRELGHFILVEPDKDNQRFLIINPPYSPAFIRVDEFGNEKLKALLISKEGLLLLKLRKYSLVILLLGGALLVYFIPRAVVAIRSRSGKLAISTGLLTIAALGMQSCSDEQQGGAKIRVDARNFDVGNVWSTDSSEVIQVSYSVTNVGNDVLRPLRIETSCLCAGVEPFKELSPGESGELVLKIVPNPRPIGEYKVTAVVESNAQNEKKLMLSADFSIFPTIYPVPSALGVETDSEIRIGHEDVEIHFQSPSHLNLESAFRNATLERFPAAFELSDTEVLNAVEELGDYSVAKLRFHFEVTPEAEAGRYFGDVVIRDGRIPREDNQLVIPVTWDHSKPYRFTKALLHLGYLTPEKTSVSGRAQFLWNDRSIGADEFELILDEDGDFSLELLDTSEGEISFEVQYRHTSAKRPPEGSRVIAVVGGEEIARLPIKVGVVY